MRGASGQAGHLKVGYQVAITLGEWSLVLEPRLPVSYTFRATVTSRNEFWSTQAPMDLVLPVGSAVWIWCGVTVSYEAPDRIVVGIGTRPEVSPRAIDQRQQQGAV